MTFIKDIGSKKKAQAAEKKPEPEPEAVNPPRMDTGYHFEEDPLPEQLESLIDQVRSLPESNERKEILNRLHEALEFSKSLPSG